MPERMKDNQYFFPNASRSIRSVPKFNSRKKKKKKVITTITNSVLRYKKNKTTPPPHYIGTDKHIHVHHNKPKPRTI